MGLVGFYQPDPLRTLRLSLEQTNVGPIVKLFPNVCVAIALPVVYW